ncbi:putative ribonuclease H-like domain-containing protein [Tanacetum coccineum]|uniref:Ribonuclease H-like domain-containing protein n=1 Tax=Tanacetum coccineum TaxID=301880 RepID=A0ABQ5IF22_9ASTR
MYSFDLKNVVPSGDLTFLFAKSTIDESKLWHRRLGHVNFKTMNKLVKGNLIRGLPSKIFDNDHNRVACQKGKQHKASCLARCDNETKFKNREMNEFYGLKRIKREFSIARTPQQNKVAERKNRTLIEAARTMLADSLLPTVFWAEAVNTTCYILNRVLVTKPYNKTPYELIIGRPPSISFMRPFGCPVTILNTLDPLGKFNRKADEGFLVGYSVNSKAFRVFNTNTRKVEENLHVNFLENKPNVVGQGANWIFDINSLTNSINYQPVSIGNQTKKNTSPQEANGDTGLKKSVDARQSEGKNKEATKQSDAVRKEFEAQCNRQHLSGKSTKASSTNNFNTVSTLVNTAGGSRIFGNVGSSFVPLSKFTNLPHDPLMPDLEDIAEMLISTTWNLQLLSVLKKFGFSNIRTASTPMETNKALTKDEDGEDVDVYLYRTLLLYWKLFLIVTMQGASLTGNLQQKVLSFLFELMGQCIGSKIYVDYGYNFMQTKIHVDNESAICVVKNPVYHSRTKRIEIRHHFIRDSHEKILIEMVKMEDFFDRDYAGASLDRKSTTGCCQFLGKRLISWQCKKQTIVANSTTEAEYVAAANCCGQNPVFYSKTKHIEIRHHFIRDCYEKKLIRVIKIHTDHNVAGLLTKAFDVSRFNFLIASIGLLNLQSIV